MAGKTRKQGAHPEQVQFLPLALIEKVNQWVIGGQDFYGHSFRMIGHIVMVANVFRRLHFVHIARLIMNDAAQWCASN